MLQHVEKTNHCRLLQMMCQHINNIKNKKPKGEVTSPFGS